MNWTSFGLGVAAGQALIFLLLVVLELLRGGRAGTDPLTPTGRQVVAELEGALHNVTIALHMHRADLTYVARAAKLAAEEAPAVALAVPAAAPAAAVVEAAAPVVEGVVNSLMQQSEA